MYLDNHVYYVILLVLGMFSNVFCEVCDHQCSSVDTDGWFSQLMVCDITFKNATLMWRRDENTANASYIVLYEDVIGNQIRSDSITGDDETFTHTIPDLTPETDYSVQVCQPELNTCGNCEVTFTTPAATVPSGPPEELMILTSGPSTLTVLWSAPATYREVVTGYIIRCAPQNDGSNYMELSRISTRFSAPFHNLIPNTTYNCEVYTTSAFGNSTPATGSASTPPRETEPGVMFIVAQNEIQYVELSESSLAMFFSILEDLNSVLDGTQLTDIAGVDYHFHRKELYLALSNGSILRYSNLSLDDENRELIVRVDQLPTGVYTAMQENTLGCITVDWLFDNVYWTEIESSLTKVYRMDITTGDVLCEVAWESRLVDKIGVDPVHGYLYWSVYNDTDNGGLFRGPLNDFRKSQSSTCPDDTPMEEVVFLSQTLVDFVLEPDVFIYFIADNTVHFIGFDKQNNGSITEATGILVESFGEITVSFTSSNFGRRCNTETRDCFDLLARYMGANNIDDVLVFRKSKQPLPVPPSFPADVRVFSGSESATISWKMPSFALSFFGSSAYDDWMYCVKYRRDNIDTANMKSDYTRGLQLNLTSLESDTLYRFIVSAIGPGGEKATPNEFLFRTKPAESETATLLISTDAAVMVSNLDGSNSMHVSTKEEIRQSTKESNGVAYDIRSSLFFWIIQGGQSTLYRYNISSDVSSKLSQGLDTPISVAADWVGRRVFWVQDGTNVADDRQLVSINMDGGEYEVFTEDPRITSIAVDSLNGRLFWITGKDIVAMKLNGLAIRTCITVESEPLAVTLDVERQYLYWMTFNNENNTVELNQLAYTIEECGKRAVSISLPGNLLASSSRGVLTYGLGALYLTTISSSSQSIYVLPADFASFASIVGDSVKPAFGVIPQTDVVRDIRVMSQLLQPLPDGLTTPGLSSISAGPLSFHPRLRKNESSTSVIVIEWGKSVTNINKPIVYEVVYSLTPFRQPTMETMREFTTDTSLRLENQTFFTKVVVTVTPHTLWLKSNESLSRTSMFSSTPMEPGKVMNIRAYVYRPRLDDATAISALIVWDALDVVEGGGIVNNYRACISGADSTNLELNTTRNESYLIVREFTKMSTEDMLANTLFYPLERNRTYTVQVSALNDGGAGVPSDSVTFSTESVSPPQELLAVGSGQSFLYGNIGMGDSYVVADPVSVNTIARLIYWYNSSLNSVMMQSLDGDTISVFLEDSPISVSTMAFEWQGEMLYMAGFNSTTDSFELWRAPVVYSKDLERVHQLPKPVQSVTHLVVDSFRRGRAYWLQTVDENVSLEFLNLSGRVVIQQETIHLSDLCVSALTLEPVSGNLWVSNKTNGKIFRCLNLSEPCEEVVNTGIMVSSISLDENSLHWTDGSVIASVGLADPNNTPNVYTSFGDVAIISLHTLSPGQQPQYYQCEQLTTCLAPDVFFEFRRSLPNVTNINMSNTSIEVSWSLPPLRDCCAGNVFSYPLVGYNYGLTSNSLVNPQDPFERRLEISKLRPFNPYNIFLSMYNLYTRSISGDPTTEALAWLSGLKTDIGVPDPVDELSAVAFGTTCIEVSWSCPINLHGPSDDRRYFLTYSGGSHSFTNDVGASRSATLEDVIPGVNYTIEVRVSNGKFNSTVAALNNIMSWPVVPAPEVKRATSTSMVVVLELEVIHSNITSVFIEAVTSEVDGINQNSSEHVVNATLPALLTFSISHLSAFTNYGVGAVATYVTTECNTSQYTGKPVYQQTERGVPDSPELEIDSSGVASWNAVNQRTDAPGFSYIFQVFQEDGEIVLTRDVGNTLTTDLKFLDLEVDRNYNVCLTARNNIGNSTTSCRPYKHMAEDPSLSSGLTAGEYAAIGCAAAVLLLIPLLAGFIVYCVHKRRGQKSLARLAYAYGPDLELSNIRAQRYHRTNAGNNHQSSMWSRETFVATEEELAQLNQFPRQYITLENFLGQGEFGEVYQGTALDILGVDTGSHPVAIKTFRKGASLEEKLKFLSEAALMGRFEHPNIVKILGICVDNDPVFIIMELMPAGDLLKFLREARPESGPALLTREEQLHIIKNIAQGCRYLEQHHFIHRDLAARNCLVSSKGADRIVKIGDFGLARDLYSSDYYLVEGERKLPVRWMAPEALLQGKFTIESDVWAYGVLLYEVMSFGNQPYPGQSNQDVLQFVTGGGRLPRPDNCPQKFYRHMMKCWRKYASERPRFEEICQYLDNIMEDMKRESYCESDSDDAETLSREGSKRFPTRSPSFKSGFQNLVRSGSKKLRNSLRRHSMHRKEEQTTHTSVSSCANLIPTESGDTFPESGLI